METMIVMWNGQGPVAMEENSHRFISDSPVKVPCTAYYLRRLADGELKTVDAEKPAKEVK